MVTPGALRQVVDSRGSGRDQQGQRGGHQLLGSVLSRGCGPLDHLELADLVEGCGAGLRCDTHEDGILISLKCRDLDADRLLPAVGWMVRQPHLNESQIALERELSLQALQRQREDPFHRAFDGWRQIAYGQGPYGHDPLGIAQDLERLSRPQLQRLAHDLESEGSVLALSGAIPADASERLQEWFGPITSQSPVDQAQADDAPANNPSANNPSANNRDRPSISVQPLATEQVVLMLGQASLPHGHPDDLALRLLQAHLGSGMSSLLFRRLREEHGVAYDVGVHHPARAGAAPFVMHASTGVDRAALTLELLMASWSELLEDCIDAAIFTWLQPNSVVTWPTHPRPRVSEPNDGLSFAVSAFLINTTSNACRNLRRCNRAICSLPLSVICKSLS